MATVALTAENFDEVTHQDGIVLVDFWAAWCSPCLRFAPTYERSSEKHPDITFGKVDTEDQPALAGAARITSIPTLMAFKGSTLVFSQPGALPAAALEQVIAAVREVDVEALRAEAARQEARQAQAGR